MIFGLARINPFEHNDLLPMQIELLRSKPEHTQAYLLTFGDLFDFSACLFRLADYKMPTESAQNWFRRAAFQIQSAGATLCSSFDTRGAIQSSLLGVEFSLKAALAEKGKKDTDLKELRHNLPKLAEEVGKLYSTFERASVEERIRRLPELVSNRYSPDQPNRIETGKIVMDGQHIAGAIARAVTENSFWKQCAARP